MATKKKPIPVVKDDTPSLRQIADVMGALGLRMEIKLVRRPWYRRAPWGFIAYLTMFVFLLAELVLLACPALAAPNGGDVNADRNAGHESVSKHDVAVAVTTEGRVSVINALMPEIRKIDPRTRGFAMRRGVVSQSRAEKVSAGDDENDVQDTPAPVAPLELQRQVVEAVSASPLRIQGGLLAFVLFVNAIKADWPYVQTFAIKLADQAPLQEVECRTTRRRLGDPGTQRCLAHTSTIGGSVLIQDGANTGEVLTFVACGMPCWDMRALRFRHSTNELGDVTLDLVR